ncbi:hypothetical protein [Corynebacterium falsenii]|uniref:hypothetical protein n=1 Tax=Corynebacterium falsenii TaxID=108486 RepID=UPI003FD3D1A4
MHNLPLIRSIAHRYHLSAEQFVGAMEATLPIAARVGTRMNDRHVAAIAKASGLPASADVFASPEGLYYEALRYAHACTWPRPASADDVPTKVTPATAVRQLVRETYARFEDNPNALRLIASENIFGDGDISPLIGVLKDSPVVLHVDRVLMLGHDIGAFREGVSAEDVYILMSSLCSFAITQGRTFHALYGMDAFDETNRRGLVELTCDAVLAFLTTTMPTEQGSSYTHSSHSAAVGSSVAASLYSTDHSAAGTHPLGDGAGFGPLDSDATTGGHAGVSDLYHD